MIYQARLKKEYKERVTAALKEEFGYANVMQVPKLQKIIPNSSSMIHEGWQDKKSALKTAKLIFSEIIDRLFH